MKNRSFIVVVFFSLFCVVFFSGQRRSNTSRGTTVRPAPSRPAPPREAAPKTPPAPETIVSPLDSIPLVVLTPKDIRWPKRQPGDRSTAPQTVTLLGDPREPGLYVTRTRIPRGKQVVPHVHPDSRTVVVLSGTYYYGIGDEFDPERLIAFPAGSFLTEPAGIPHFTWAKDGEVVIQTTAIGPSDTRLLPDKKPDAVRGSTNSVFP